MIVDSAAGLILLGAVVIYVSVLVIDCALWRRMKALHELTLKDNQVTRRHAQLVLESVRSAAEGRSS